FPGGSRGCQRRPTPKTRGRARASLVLDSPRSHPLVAAGQESRTTCHAGITVVIETDASVGDDGAAVAAGPRGRAIRRNALPRSTLGRAGTGVLSGQGGQSSAIPRH